MVIGSEIEEGARELGTEGETERLSRPICRMPTTTLETQALISLADIDEQWPMVRFITIKRVRGKRGTYNLINSIV
jgi:hypothetical protein